MKPEEAKRLARRSRAAGGRGDRSRSRERDEDLAPEDKGRGSDEREEGAGTEDEVRRSAQEVQRLQTRLEKMPRWQISCESNG